MTWAEFKAEVEKRGVKDGDDIGTIQLSEKYLQGEHRMVNYLFVIKHREGWWIYD